MTNEFQGSLPDPEKITREDMERRLSRMRRVRCPEHGNTPNAKLRKTSSGDYEIEARNFCCADLRKRADGAFAAR